MRTIVQLCRGSCMNSQAATSQGSDDMYFCAEMPCDLLHRTLAHQRFQRPPQQGRDSLCQMVKLPHLPRMSQRGIAMVPWKTGRALLAPCLLKVPPQGLRGSTVSADSLGHENICYLLLCACSGSTCTCMFKALLNMSLLLNPASEAAACCTTLRRLQHHCM